LGLSLNCSKCELITRDHFQVSDPCLQSFSAVTVEDVSLLGAPLFPGHVLDAEWSRRCADLSKAMERLESIESQGALILLRASFGAPKVQHLLRCCPSLNHPALQTFDALLRSGVPQITNSDLSATQWIQASLPSKMVVWESDECLRSHFLPFWLQRQALSLSRTVYWQRALCMMMLEC
jgi:hypothetical protein